MGEGGGQRTARVWGARHAQSSLMPLDTRMAHSTWRFAICVVMSIAESSMKGVHIVSLAAANAHVCVSVREYQRKSVGAEHSHGEDDHADAPAVDEVVVALVVPVLDDNFRREVRGRAAQRLWCTSSVSNARETGAVRPTCSAVRVSTALARPKSAILTTGGLSSVRRMFSGLRSRWAMPRLWTYYLAVRLCMVNTYNMAHRKRVADLVR